MQSTNFLLIPTLEGINLSMYFITEDLPVDSSEVVTALRIKQVRHLSWMSDKTIQDANNVNVELLINRIRVGG